VNVVISSYVERQSKICQSPVLEIGSLLLHGHDHIESMRGHLAGFDYIGVDICSGPGVDQVCDGKELPFRDEFFSTVLCLETLEHVDYPLKVIGEIHRVLRYSGKFIFSTPFFHEIHEYPSDYWRFTPQCWDEVLLRDFGYREVKQSPPKAMTPRYVMGYAIKE